MKNFFAAHKGAYDEHLKKVTAARAAEESPGTAFLFHVRKPADKTEIVASFPDKATADTLVARYFNSGDYASRKHTIGIKIMASLPNYSYSPQGLLPEKG